VGETPADGLADGEAVALGDAEAVGEGEGSGSGSFAHALRSSAASTRARNRRGFIPREYTPEFAEGLPFFYGN